MHHIQLTTIFLGSSLDRKRRQQITLGVLEKNKFFSFKENILTTTKIDQLGYRIKTTSKLLELTPFSMNLFYSCLYCVQIL